MTGLHDKTNPFLACIKERYSLCSETSAEAFGKSVQHIVLSLKGSSLSYKVGDSIAIAAENDPVTVDRILCLLKALGTEVVEDRKGERFKFVDFLKKKANLADVPRKLIVEFALRHSNPEKKAFFETLLGEENKEALKTYQSTHEVWDALEENSEISLSPQEFASSLMPLLPRFYSIASSMIEVGDEVHLTVAELEYVTNGHVRRGVCTHYLCHLAPLHEHVIPVYIQPSSGFIIPEDGTIPIIMIGPGTGVAPYRGFMQERLKRGDEGLNWLFFGEWHREHHFFYGDYWLELEKMGKLRLETAFSRDQEHKVYVQHKMLEHGKDLFAFIEKGAHIYVCGDASQMAKDVDSALHQIIQQHGMLDEVSTKEYIKKLKTDKRYLRDVY